MANKMALVVVHTLHVLRGSFTPEIVVFHLYAFDSCRAICWHFCRRLGMLGTVQPAP